MDDLSESYQILDLEPGASIEDVRRSYRELVKVWHPDRFDGEMREHAEHQTARINEAYSVLRDADSRSTYDARLDYDAGTSTMKTGLTVTGKGDKKWHHEVVTLRDAVLRHGGTKGADLALVNTDDKDDIFSLIEVHRGMPEPPELRPRGLPASETATNPPKAKTKKR